MKNKKNEKYFFLLRNPAKFASRRKKLASLNSLFSTKKKTRTRQFLRFTSSVLEKKKLSFDKSRLITRIGDNSHGGA
jgi:hypothetical protein